MQLMKKIRLRIMRIQQRRIATTESCCWKKNFVAVLIICGHDKDWDHILKC